MISPKLSFRRETKKLDYHRENGSAKRARGMKRVQERRALLLFSAVVITLCSAFTAYYRCFAGLAFWDDEGTMMAGVKRLLSGDVLYDQIHTMYGPVYYLYQW